MNENKNSHYPFFSKIQNLSPQKIKKKNQQQQEDEKTMNKLTKKIMFF